MLCFLPINVTTDSSSTYYSVFETAKKPFYMRDKSPCGSNNQMVIVKVCQGCIGENFLLNGIINAFPFVLRFKSCNHLKQARLSSMQSSKTPDIWYLEGA